MAQPLRKPVPGPVQSRQFAHFGVLDDGAQSKASTLSAVVINILLAFVIIVIGAAARKQVIERAKLDKLVYTEIKPIEPIKPKVLPKPPVKLPEVPKIVVQPPKITVNLPKPPELPPTPVVKMEAPKPVNLPEVRPLKITPPPAPKAVSFANPQAASVVNNSPKPSAVSLGSPNNPIAVSNRPAVASVNLGQKGMAGMPSSNTGSGAPTKVNLAGNGAPGSNNMGPSRGAVAVSGFATGDTTGHGTAARGGPAQVTLARNDPPPSQPQRQLSGTSPQRSVPKVIFKPKPVYTQEAVAMHLEGTVQVKIRVLPDGSTQVLGISSGLGHGLDESALTVARGMKFEPALNAAGAPIPWEGVVSVSFLLAG